MAKTKKTTSKASLAKKKKSPAKKAQSVKKTSSSKPSKKALKPKAKKNTAKKSSSQNKKKAPAKTKASKPAIKKTMKPVKTKAVKKDTHKAKPKKSSMSAEKKPKLTSKPAAPKKPTPKVEMSKPIKKPVAPKTSEYVPGEAAATLIGSLNFEPYVLEKNEEYMNPPQLTHFKKILLAWKDQLMQEADTTVEHMKEEAIFYPDILDRASQEEKFTLELRTRDRERKLIKKIEQAMDAIDNQEYGYCEDCGAEIGIRRLEARPTAVKCIDCKTYEEIREKQVGGG
jgi:DnaK suppressor protein